MIEPIYKRAVLWMDMTGIGSRIMRARKKAGFTQEELAEKIGVTAQAVSKWENGHNLPDLENLLQIAEITNVPYSVLLEDQWAEGMEQFVIRGRLFQEDNMYTRMKTTALAEHLSQTYRALSYMRERHAGQFRKSGKRKQSRLTLFAFIRMYSLFALQNSHILSAAASVGIAVQNFSGQGFIDHA